MLRLQIEAGLSQHPLCGPEVALARRRDHRLVGDLPVDEFIQSGCINGIYCSGILDFRCGKPFRLGPWPFERL